jgi:hypothetical protein
VPHGLHIKGRRVNYWFLIAGATISLVAMIFHGFVGGKVYMKKMNNSAIPALTKILSFVSWHIFTTFPFVSAITLAYIAYDPQFVRAAYPVIGVIFLGALLFLYLGLGQHRVLLKMPGAYLMGGTALLAWLGIS